MKYLLIAFGAVFLYRLLTNISYLVRVKHYDKEYTAYLSHPEKDFKENTAALTKLFLAAGLTDRQIHFVQPMGFGQLLQGSTLLFSNMDNRREDVVGNMISCFAEARGAFKSRILENFSPLFWIKQILFLPQSILNYLGVKADSIISKLFQVLYWLITPLIIAFRDSICEYILGLIN